MTQTRPGTNAQRPRLAGVELRVRQRLHRLPLANHPTVLLGYSGGPDSLALAAVLATLAGRGDLRLVAAHVDHAWQETSADEQARAVELARLLGVAVRTQTLEPGVAERHPGVGLEEASRRERYLALRELAAEVGADLVATAHHRADQAETVLLHILRGAGLAGAAGMAELASLDIPWWGDATLPRSQVLCWRPFLTESRETLRNYLAGRGLTPITDPSNDDLRFRRNLIRHRVLPVLEDAVPGAEAALARFAEIVAEDDAALDEIASADLSSLLDGEGNLSIRALKGRPLAIQRRVLRRWLGRHGLAASFERLEAVRSLLDAEGGKRIELEGGGCVRGVGGRLRFEPRSQTNEAASAEIQVREREGGERSPGERWEAGDGHATLSAPRIETDLNHREAS